MQQVYPDQWVQLEAVAYRDWWDHQVLLVHRELSEQLALRVQLDFLVPKAAPDPLELVGLLER